MMKPLLVKFCYRLCLVAGNVSSAVINLVLLPDWKQLIVNYMMSQLFDQNNNKQQMF